LIIHPFNVAGFMAEQKQRAVAFVQVFVLCPPLRYLSGGITP